MDRRERTPRLAVQLDSPTPAPNDRVIYRVRNDGPQDLDSVLMYQPRTRDRITYPVMRTEGTKPCRAIFAEQADSGWRRHRADA